MGVRVEVFSIGFGKRLFGFRRGDTDYRLSLLPLGGYVKMSGESPAKTRPGTRLSLMPTPLAAYSHRPGFSVELSACVAAHDWLLYDPRRGGTFRSQAANIDFVSDHTAAASAGFKAGDVITHYDSVNNPNWEQVSIRSAMNMGKPFRLTSSAMGKSSAPS